MLLIVMNSITVYFNTVSIVWGVFWSRWLMVWWICV